MKFSSDQTKIVGTIHTLPGLQAALGVDPAFIDFLEIRLDAFLKHEKQIVPLLSKLKIPLIITVRHHLEGGGQLIPIFPRRELFKKFLPYAAMIDVELRSVIQLSDIIQQARAKRIGVIVSSHHFRSTPSLKQLRLLAQQAVKVKADIFKIATFTSTPGELQRLLSLLEQEKRIPLSVMGMGRYGKVSRLLFAQAGSILNYGFLDKAQLKGQWPALILKKRIGELLE